MSSLFIYNQNTNQIQKTENFIFPYLIINFHFFKHENLLPFMQDRTTCPHHEQDKFLPHLSLFWLYLRQSVCHICLRLHRDLLPWLFQQKFWISFCLTICVTCPTHPNLQCQCTLVISFMLQIMQVLIVQFSPVSCYFLSCSPSIPLRTLFSNTLSMFLLHVVVCSSVNAVLFCIS